MDIRNAVLAILVGGAPAPGINGVISSVTIEALNSNCSVLGFFEGFKQMKSGRSMVLPLEWNDVTQIYNKGGSILRTSKKQITTAQDIDNCLRVLQHHRVRYLVTIGGTQTAYSASLLAAAAAQNKYLLSIVHVPKTIFDDLPLPSGSRCFGFNTAVEVGSNLVKNFANDARTMLRWYILVVMGQKAGHLALAMGKAGAATLTIIPEEYQNKKINFQDLATTLEGAIYKRRAMDKDYGVAIVCEGLVDIFDPMEVKERFGNVDEGHQELGTHLVKELQKRFTRNGLDITLVARSIGNELRAADPNAHDISLTRDLGFAATRVLFEGGNDVMVTLTGDRINPIPLQSQLDAEHGSTQIRAVDIHSLSYQVAKSYMIKLTTADLQDSLFLSKLSKAANLSQVEVVKQFNAIATPIASFSASTHSTQEILSPIQQPTNTEKTPTTPAQ